MPGKTAWSYDSSTGTMNKITITTENQRKHSFFQYTTQKKSTQKLDTTLTENKNCKQSKSEELKFSLQNGTTIATNMSTYERVLSFLTQLEIAEIGKIIESAACAYFKM